jgi:GNAT superfamily N-acetyltransferase
MIGARRPCPFLFPMEIRVLDPDDRRQVKDFLTLPFEVYKHTPQWVPALAGDERARLDLRRNPYYRHSSAEFLLAYHRNRPVGRLAVLDNRRYNDTNQEHTAFFCMFECLGAAEQPQQAREVAQALFTTAFDWARSRGLTRMLGPKGFTALDGLGMLVKGFEFRPALGLPYNPQEYPGLVEALGFGKVNDIVSGFLDPDFTFPERIHDLADRLRERRGLHIARFRSRSELRRMLKHLKTLYNGALEGTPDGIPLDDQEVRTLANQMLWFADPRLIKMVMKDDQPVGFLLAYPDISAGLQKTRGRLLPFGWVTMLRALRTTDWININGAGMLAEYRGSGGTAILYSELFKSVRENPRYRHAEVVQVGLENDKMQRELVNFGVQFTKVHRLYQKSLA